MKIIGQPDTYNDILNRIFWSTFAVAIGCSFALGRASPTVKRLLEEGHLAGDFGPFKGLKLGYIVVPLLIAGLFRIVKLHDLISDLFHIRERIDIRHIIHPLANVARVQLDDAKRTAIGNNRKDVMYNVFYKYVTLPDSAINAQLVRSALDNYGWLWSFMEGQVLLVLTWISLLLLRAMLLALLVFATSALFALLAYFMWSACMRSTAAEVKAILGEFERRREVEGYLNRL